jgi:hypothetical protein
VRFILFHGKKHPKDMGENEISTFISYLTVKKNVAASTQSPAEVMFIQINMQHEK